MATKIKIGHASISENGTINGEAGDSTTKEVCVVDNYDIVTRLNPHIVLRPKTQALADLSASACEAGCLNNNIGYSQYGTSNRNTLYNKASAVGYNLANVTTKCNTDCSAFMTVCAIAGGARINYGDNAPTTSNMRARFEQSGDYDVLTDAKHTKMTDYLKRGDILVREGKHTVMVLANGCNHHSSTTYSDTTSAKQVQVRLIEVEIISIEATNIAASIKPLNKNDSAEEPLKDHGWLKEYSWQYTVDSIGSVGKTFDKRDLKVTSASTKLTISGLAPGCSYILKVMATKTNGSDKLSSRSLIFTTPKAPPTSVKNLTVSFDEAELLNKKCKISFDAPASWGVDASKTGYRLSLLVNGKVVAYSDNILTSTATHVNKTIRLRDITTKNFFGYFDTIQLGIQTWIKDAYNNVTFDNACPVCSQPIYIKASLNRVNKAFVKLKDGFKRVIIYNNIEEV